MYLCINIVETQNLVICTYVCLCNKTCRENETKQESLQVGGDAKKTMVEANMRMVISIARKYRHYGVSLTDLIQVGKRVNA